MITRKFVWELWADPLNGTLMETEWPGHETPVNENGEVSVEMIDISEHDTTVIREEWDDEPMHSITPIKVAQTKQGMLTLTEHALAVHQFNFWTLHVNFDIGDKEALAMEKSYGVETLDVLTRYRARIGFPKSTKPKYDDKGMWDLNELKRGIEDSLTALDNTPEPEDVHLDYGFTDELQGRVDDIKKDVSKSRYWAILVLPNGNLESITSEHQNDKFDSDFKFFEECQAATGGVLLTSEV